MAASVPLHIDAGATFDSITLRYLQDDGVTPVDLTGWTARVQVREHATDYDAVIDDVPVIDGNDVILEFTATQTAALTKSRYVWACEITDGDQVIRLAEGSVYVSLEIVR